MSNLAHKEKLRCYSHDQIPYVWDDIKPHIEKALERGSNYTLIDVFYGLCRKEMQLWCYKDEASLVTAIQTDEVKHCLLLAVGGSKLGEWVKYLPIVEDWARSKDCTEMRIYGRIAWSKVLNYGIDYARMSKSI